MTDMTDHEEDELLTELADLKKAMRQGVKSVTYRDRTVTYRSFSEMRQIRTDLENELGLGRQPRTYYAYASKGVS